MTSGTIFTLRNSEQSVQFRVLQIQKIKNNFLRAKTRCIILNSGRVQDFPLDFLIDRCTYIPQYIFMYEL